MVFLSFLFPTNELEGAVTAGSEGRVRRLRRRRGPRLRAGSHREPTKGGARGRTNACFPENQFALSLKVCSSPSPCPPRSRGQEPGTGWGPGGRSRQPPRAAGRRRAGVAPAGEPFFFSPQGSRVSEEWDMGGLSQGPSRTASPSNPRRARRSVSLKVAARSRRERSPGKHALHREQGKQR